MSQSTAVKHSWRCSVMIGLLAGLLATVQAQMARSSDVPKSAKKWPVVRAIREVTIPVRARSAEHATGDEVVPAPTPTADDAADGCCGRSVPGASRYKAPQQGGCDSCAQAGAAGGCGNRGSGGCQSCDNGGGRGCRRCRGNRGVDRWFNCNCDGSYKFPVPPLYTYHWPGLYSQQLMTDYHSPWRFVPLKPYTDEPLPEARATDRPELPDAPRPSTATTASYLADPLDVIRR